jgi:purine-nucleoside phosphorylase
MIRFDPERETVFGPFDLKLDGAPSKCLLVFDDEIWEDYILPNKEIETFPVTNAYGRTFDTYRYLKHNGENILLVSPTTGAAGCVCDTEILIGSGIKKIVAFGTCGRLDKNIAQNTIILPTSAYREEGTSYHYLPESDEIEADKEALRMARDTFTNAGVNFIEGKIWTTDAVYRETRGKVELMKERGCVGVEMELSALLALAQYRDIKFTEFLIGDDPVDGNVVEPIERKNEANFNCAIDIREKL